MCQSSTAPPDSSLTGVPLTVLKHVTDVHCHPTDSPISVETVANLPVSICAMSTRPSDQALVRALSESHPSKVIPCFGYHPWFSHWICLEDTAPSKEDHYRSLFNPESEDSRTVFWALLPHLPDPTPLRDILGELRRNLTEIPRAMLGEVGIDRAARVAVEYTADPRVLTPFTVPLEHQLAILEAQFDVGVELGRNASVHSVKCPQITTDFLEKMKKKWGKKWEAISVDMHSCGLSAETWKSLENKHANLYLSLSVAINGRSPNHKALIASCSPDRLLVESDYNTIDFCAPMTWEMVLTVSEVKGWKVEDKEWEEDNEISNPELEHYENWGVVRRLETNWKAFRRGGSRNPKESKKARKGRQQSLMEIDESE